MRTDKEIMELVRDEWLKVSVAPNMFSKKDMFFYKHRGFNGLYRFVAFLHVDKTIDKAERCRIETLLATLASEEDRLVDTYWFTGVEVDKVKAYQERLDFLNRLIGEIS